jgi:hypothetical protein
VHDRLLVHAVELSVVHLVGIAQRGGRCRQPLTVAPHPRLGAASPTRAELGKFARPRLGASADPHGEGIEDRRLGGTYGVAGKILKSRRRDVPGKGSDGIDGNVRHRP